MDHIEHHFAEPTATPADIVDFVASLPSSTVPDGRAMPDILVQRLMEIAARYDGRVPLHGRLFAQWMHHAYPRECPYPHISGTTQPQTVKEYKAQSKLAPTLTKDALKEAVEAAKLETQDAGSDECTMWSEHEELYVGDHRMSLAKTPRQGIAMSLLRLVVYACMATATVGMLANRSSVFIS